MVAAHRSVTRKEFVLMEALLILTRPILKRAIAMPGAYARRTGGSAPLSHVPVALHYRPCPGAVASYPCRKFVQPVLMF
jgi:hypothetical protein